MSVIAAGGHDGPLARERTIKIRNTKTGELIATLKGHTRIVGCLAWTNDGKTLISGSLDHSIRTWNTKTWKQTALLEAHTFVVHAIAISPNDRILASASFDNTVLLWNLDNGQLISSPLQHSDFVYCVSFSTDGKLLATGCGDRNVYTWDSMASPTAKPKETLAMTPHQKFKGHTKAVRGVIHLPGGQRTITCSVDGSLRVWNLKSGKQIGEDWRDGESQVYCIALSPDGKKVVSGSEDGGVRLWDIDKCKVIVKWMGHTQSVCSICWSRDGRRVLSGSEDGTARQWDMESGETILEPIKTGHSDVWAVVYSPDMSMIATGGRDGPWTRTDEPIECSIKIWNTKTDELVAILKGHTQTMGCLAWTEDGQTLISGSDDKSIRTWNTKTWKQTALLEAHTYWVWAIAISPNDRILASASYDQTALLWNLDNGQPIGPPLRHAHCVNSISFSEDGKLLTTGCQDTNTYAWDVAAIVKGASVTRSPVQQCPPTHQIPQGFFDGVPPDRSHVCHHYQFGYVFLTFVFPVLRTKASPLISTARQHVS
ncbi:WD40 repeat-like protein [Suillus hirtellus]|nr:WD40 repeat-like protein [Suillus hirtellus]